MSVFLLPSTLEDELEKIMNSFWWGKRSEATRGINWEKGGWQYEFQISSCFQFIHAKEAKLETFMQPRYYSFKGLQS